ncbi:MAG: dihydropteroate synthase [Deltaproteobacteria bacterium]|nr:dihydropteroate synthase [Deltaproteobacteria bacterium]
MVPGPKIMGILNVTPDSFSDGGAFLAPADAVKQALQMEKEGADIIDIGGESSRPGSQSISIEEELKRIIPVVQELRRQSQIAISIDTTKSLVAARALEAGATMINDISAGLGDPEMFFVAAKYQVPVCLMHMQGKPQTMQNSPHYDDVVEEVKRFLALRIEVAVKTGIPKNKIIIDPGIGFGKRLGDNIALLKNCDRFQGLGCPILIGASRKSFIGQITGAPVQDRLPGSLAATAIATQKGASILRVHDVAATKNFLLVFSVDIRLQNHFYNPFFLCCS